MLMEILFRLKICLHYAYSFCRVYAYEEAKNMLFYKKHNILNRICHFELWRTFTHNTNNWDDYSGLETSVMPFVLPHF